MNTPLSYKSRQYRAKFKRVLQILSYWVEYISWLIFSTAKFRKYPCNVSKILIVNYGALGDLFCSMRIVKNLSDNYKDKELFLAIPNQYYNSLKEFSKIINARIIPMEDIKYNKFDLTLLFAPYQIKEHKDNLGFCVGSEYSSIRGSINSFNYLFLNRKIMPGWRHKIEQELQICKLAQLEISLPLKDSIKIKLFKHGITNILKRNKIKKFAVIHPSGRNFSKIFSEGKIPAMAWPLARFAGIADYLAEEYNFDIIITGTKEEKFIGDLIKKNARNKSRIHNFSGKLGVEELTNLVSLAKIIISVDTSIVHIAEFTGTPIIALFGPTFSEEVGAYGNSGKQINLAHPEKCVRDRRKGSSYDKDNVCMNSISTEEVKNAVHELLG